MKSFINKILIGLFVLLALIPIGLIGIPIPHERTAERLFKEFKFDNREIKTSIEKLRRPFNATTSIEAIKELSGYGAEVIPYIVRHGSKRKLHLLFWNPHSGGLIFPIGGIDRPYLYPVAEVIGNLADPKAASYLKKIMYEPTWDYLVRDQIINLGGTFDKKEILKMIEYDHEHSSIKSRIEKDYLPLITRLPSDEAAEILIGFVYSSYYKKFSKPSDGGKFIWYCVFSDAAEGRGLGSLSEDEMKLLTRIIYMIGETHSGPAFEKLRILNRNMKLNLKRDIDSSNNPELQDRFNNIGKIGFNLGITRMKMISEIYDSILKKTT